MNKEELKEIKEDLSNVVGSMCDIYIYLEDGSSYVDVGNYFFEDVDVDYYYKMVKTGKLKVTDIYYNYRLEKFILEFVEE